MFLVVVFVAVVVVVVAVIPRSMSEVFRAIEDAISSIVSNLGSEEEEEKVLLSGIKKKEKRSF